MFVCVCTEEQFKLMYFTPELRRKARVLHAPVNKAQWMNGNFIWPLKIVSLATYTH